MPFYEIVYETGRMSVAEYKDDNEAKTAIQAHHTRAVNGVPGGPLGQPAERIKAVYKYTNHPDEYNPLQAASADVLEKEVSSLIKSLKDENGVVALDQLAVEVRALSHPMVNDLPELGGSFYKTEESGKLQMSFLEG